MIEIHTLNSFCVELDSKALAFIDIEEWKRNPKLIKIIVKDEGDHDGIYYGPAQNGLCQHDLG